MKNQIIKLFFILPVFLLNQAAAQNYTTGLVARWKLDDSGTTVSDAAGSHNGWSGGVTTGVVGMVDKAFTFISGTMVGIDNHADITNYSSFTLSAWINPSSTSSSNVIVSKSIPDRDFVMRLKSGKLEAHFYNGAYRACTGTTTVPTNKWTHVLCTWSNNQWKLYYNGVLNNSCSFSGQSPPWIGNALHIGAVGGSETFLGNLDDVRIYNRALTAADAAALYNATNRTITINDISVNENAGTATFTVSTNKTHSMSFSGSYATSNGTAVAGTDYTAKSGGFLISAGTTSKTISIPILDNAVEGPDSKNFYVNISGNIPATISDGTGTCTILDNEYPMPSITINNISVVESQSSATFTIRLNETTSQTVSGSYSTSNGTAVSGSDYVAKSGTFSISPGNLTTTKSVTLISDSQVEPNQTFYLNISNAVNATIADNQGVCTIIDDTPVISVNSISIPENTGPAIFTVSLTNSVNKTITGQYYTQNGSAHAGEDYTAVSGSFSIPANTTSIQVSVPVTDDDNIEIDEVFVFTINNLSANVAIGQPSGTCTLLNDDNAGLLCTSTIVNFPYYESFEDPNNLWLNADSTDHFNWTRHSGGTPSTNTGPGSAFDGTYYNYIEATGIPGYSKAVLDGPCFDLSSVTEADFIFYYHMYGADMGTLNLLATTDGANYSCLKTIGGNQGDWWLYTSVSLDAYAGETVQLKFEATTGDGGYGDIAIDNISLLTGNVPVVSVNGYTSNVSLGLTFSNDRLQLNHKNESVSVGLPYGRSNIEYLNVSGGLLTTAISGGYILNADTLAPIWNASKINGIPLGSKLPAAGQVLKFNGTEWEPADDIAAPVTASPWLKQGVSTVYAYTTGNVGIGTANPDERLTVAGKVQAEDVEVVTQIPVPDYVFDEAYKLMKLSELESHLKECRHLPDVPSAKELEDKGIPLSEFSMVLLKKIEEMTLYLIGHDQRIKALTRNTPTIENGGK